MMVEMAAGYPPLEKLRDSQAPAMVYAQPAPIQYPAQGPGLYAVAPQEAPQAPPPQLPPTPPQQQQPAIPSYYNNAPPGYDPVAAPPGMYMPANRLYGSQPGVYATQPAPSIYGSQPQFLQS